MEIPLAQIPSPFRHVHIPRFACIDAYAVPDILLIRVLTVLVGCIGQGYADISFCRIVKGGITGHQNVLGLVLIPLCLDALKLAVFLDVTFRNGKVHGIQLILMTRAESRSFGSVEGVLDREGYGLQFLNLTTKGAFVIGVLPVPCRVAGEAVSSTYMILCGSPGAVNG